MNLQKELNEELQKKLIDELTKWLIFHNKKYGIEGVDDVSNIPEEYLKKLSRKNMHLTELDSLIKIVKSGNGDYLEKN